MSEQTKVAVVILNWNGKNFLKQFVPGVLSSLPEYARLYIADNASSDDSCDFVRQNFPQVELIELSKNYGFAGGYNKALSQLKGIPYYILLNSDVEVEEKWIEALFELMETSTDIACVQPKLRSYEDKKYFEYAGAAGGFIDFLAYPFCRGRIFDSIEEDKGQYDDVCDIAWASGAALMLRSELYHRYGGLDEDFFAHMEEIDYCWRLQKLGYRSLYCPKSVVYHVGGGTLPKGSARKTYLNFRNNLSMLYKNTTAFRFTGLLILRIPMDAVAALQMTAKACFKEAGAVGRAYLHFAALRSTNKKKRSIIQQWQNEQERKNKKSFSLKGFYKKSIVFQYYIRSKSCFSKLDPKDF